MRTQARAQTQDAISDDERHDKPDGNCRQMRAAQIVTGVGFLGAGTILRSGVTISGLTTAATIWATAAIGMAVGSGLYIVSVSGTVLVLVILYVFAPARRKEE